MQIEISGKLLRLIRALAEAQGRDEGEVLEEAVLRYLRELGTESELGIGREIGELYVVGRTEERPRSQFLSLITRMSSRFDLDEDEAMRIAVGEQHAFRRERRSEGTDDS